VLHFEINVFARKLLEHHVLAGDEGQQIFVVLQSCFLMPERFPQNIADIVFVRFQQRADSFVRASAINPSFCL